MPIWKIGFYPKFAVEFEALPRIVGLELIVAMDFIARTGGPNVGRPLVDTLFGSKHTNLKEIRIFVPNGAWRFAFAFDPKRQGIILVGGNKSGGKEERFYRNLIRTADARYSDHLERLKNEGE